VKRVVVDVPPAWNDPRRAERRRPAPDREEHRRRETKDPDTDLVVEEEKS